MKRSIHFAALALLAMASLLLPGCSKAGYLRVIETNWDISFPSDAEEVFSASTSGFHGDGERYHVFQYDDFGGLEPLLSWEDSAVDDGRDYPAVVTDALEVAEEELPRPGAYKRCRRTQEDGSFVVFLFSEEHSLLYVFEWFQ